MSGSRSYARRLYDGWLLIAAQFGEAQTLILVALVYWLAVGPAAVIMKLGRGDPLHKRGLGSGGSVWFNADSVANPDLERAKRLF